MRKLLAIALFVLTLLWGSGTAFADGSTVKELSLQEAIDKAIAHSSDLRVSGYKIDQAELAVEAAEENADNAADAAVYAVESGDTYSDLISGAAIASNNLTQKEMAWNSAKKDYQAQKDSIVISVYQAYYGVLQAEAALDVAQQALNQADLQYRGTNLKYQFGFASRLQVQQEGANLEAAKQSYASSENALASAYEKLNQMIGLQPDDRPVLTDRPVFSPLQIDSLDAEISRALDESPAVWKADAAVEQAKLALDNAGYSPIESHTYESMEISISIAEVNAQAEKERLSQSLRSLYSSILQLEANHAALERKLSTAEETLRMTEMKYEYGRASRADLLAAQSAVASSRQALLNAECQHAILVQAFKTPWAYGG